MKLPLILNAFPRARKYGRAGVSVAAVLGLAGTAFAAESPPPLNVISLQAEATVEVTKDVLTLTFTTTREGSDAATVQGALKQALDAALNEARSAAKPNGQLEVRTGNFALFPRYAQKGGISGWQGSAELIVEGRDMVGISQLSGKITTMTIGRVSQTLSREQREKVEADVTAQAITRYQAKATTVARQFGFTGYQIREVNVSVNEPHNYAAPMQMRAKGTVAADEALPIEAGKGTVTAMVNGSIVMFQSSPPNADGRAR
jgi:predicted secreted protein